jgi:hypothetical protein
VNSGSCLPISTGHTQKNGTVSIVFPIETALFICVCPVYRLIAINVCEIHRYTQQVTVTVFVNVVVRFGPENVPSTKTIPVNRAVYTTCITDMADPSGRAVYGIDLRPLANWDCGYESRLGHGCLSCGCCVLSGRGLCDGLVTRLEESYRVWCV